MTENWADPDSPGLLRALGQVEPPGPGVLEAAREALWSAVADEMLAAGPAGGDRTDVGRTRAAGTEPSRDDIRRRRTEPGC